VAPVVHINRLARLDVFFSTYVPIMEQTVGQGDRTRINNDNKYLRSYNITTAYDTPINVPLII